VAPLIIFSMARCGSTTLMRALNLYADIDCLIEPFTPANEGRTYLGITTERGLSDALRQIWPHHNGIKHVWHPDGWPFTSAPRLNRRLLCDEGLRVVFLNRRNDLRRVVSAEMSKQTEVWSSFTPAQRERLRTFEFAPVPAAKVEHELGVGAAGVAELRESLPDDPTMVLELWYEDLFGDDLDLPERLARLAFVHGFLAGRPEPDPATDTAPPRAEQLLDPGRWRLNSLETYHRLPNVEELERRFGSDASGWLLDEHNATHPAAWRSQWDIRHGTNT
jgi:hypothetical protein